MIYDKTIAAALAAGIVLAASSSAFAKGPGGGHAANGASNGQAAFGFASPGKKTGWTGTNPPGWSHGKKKGWNCVVGSDNCKPPGLQENEPAGLQQK